MHSPRPRSGRGCEANGPRAVSRSPSAAFALELGLPGVAVSDAHFSHLVTLALAKANIVQYWFSLRGTGRESYEGARIVFSQVVVGAAAQLKRKR